MIDALAEQLFSGLQRIDQELDLSSAKEKSWCDQLRGKLLRGWHDVNEVSVEVPYSGGSREACDLVVDLRSGQQIWLELKGAWPSYWIGRGQPGKYRTYLFYPLDSSVTADKKSAALDLKRLAIRPPATATHVGLFIMGSHRSEFDLASDLDRFEQVACLNSFTVQIYRR